SADPFPDSPTFSFAVLWLDEAALMLQCAAEDIAQPPSAAPAVQFRPGKPGASTSEGGLLAASLPRRELNMRKLRIGVLDIVSRGPTRAWFGRVMNANLASIMPQVVGVWCRQEGHDVRFVCYTGFEDLLKELPDNVDLVFIS